jgi:hypothetical protein
VRTAFKVFVVKSDGRDGSEDLGIESGIILKQMLKKQDADM